MKKLLFLLTLAPTFAQAETFVIDTKVSEVTVYPDGAEIIRAGTFDIPAGRHRLVLLGIPANEFGQQLATMSIQAEGLNQTAVVFRADDVPWHDYVSTDVKQAEDQIEGIETQITAVEDRASEALTKATAAETKRNFLADLGGNEGLAGADASTLRDIAQMIDQESQSADAAIHAAEVEARNIRKELEGLEQELEGAKADLAALLPETEDRLFLAVDVFEESDASGPITVSYLDFYNASWEPAYEFDLTTGDAPEVAIKRDVMVTQTTRENWRDIVLNISTIRPTDQNNAARLRPLRRFIQDKPQPQIARGVTSIDEPVVEAPVVVEETQGWLPSQGSVEGTGFTYTLSEPVSIASGNYEIAEFQLDSMIQMAEVYAQATPSRDSVAYRTARFTNPYSQNLQASPISKWFVDGVLVASGYGPEIGPSAEVEMGFGPIHGLTLERNILDRSSGDTGLISRSNQRVERAKIQIENFTGETWPLRIYDQVPYSEQEDLAITWAAKPRPTEENVDNKRGILAWDVELAPGESQVISLDTTLNWPDGMELR